MSNHNAQTPSVAVPASSIHNEGPQHQVAETTAEDCDHAVNRGHLPVASSESAAKRENTEKTLLDYAKTVGS
jgi:hypothetical protein